MENNMKYHIKSRDSMKTVDVIFVSDELVGSTIVSKKEYERVMRQKVKAEAEKLISQKSENSGIGEEGKTPKRKNQEISELNAKRSKYVDDVELALAALENDNVEKLPPTCPGSPNDEDDASAKKICSFENNVSKSEDDKSESAAKTRGKDVSQTPNNLRKKVIKDIKEIQKILENSDDDFSGSESDSSYRASEEESVSDSKDSSKDQSSKSYFESYCELQCGKKSKSKSKNSFKKLKPSKLTQEKLEELTNKHQISSAHKDSIKVLFAETVNLFSKWDFILEQNYNLLLYGAGSKREVLGKFVERFIDVHPVIVVNGFFPDVSDKEILEKMCSVLKIKQSASDVVERIKEKIKNYDVRIYVAINNIDGIMLRSHKVQSTLSQLARLEQVRVIASVDHINAPLIWNKSLSSEFNWVWYDSTTFLAYAEETVYEGNLMLQSSGKATLSSLRNVFNALTKNSRGIFMLMLKNQLEQGNKSGISFRELYQRSRKELLISSDVALRAQLKEFIDHLVLKQRRSADGEEQFVIVVESSIMRQFLEEQEAQGN